MRHIYLIRHGRPEFPNGIECCIGQTDCPVSKEGLHQAQRLCEYFLEIPLTAVYCSTLARAEQTASAIVRKGTLLLQNEALKELYCGDWEWLTFDEIRKNYLELYIKRESNPEQFPPARGECFADGLRRFKAAIEQIIDESTGDIAIVAHASVNRLFLCSQLQKSLNEAYTIPQPYGCINELVQENGLLKVVKAGYMPDEFPNEETMQLLCERYRTPENVLAHCRAVADKAMQLTNKLEEGRYKLNKELIYSAAMLHDIARTEPYHARQGAKWIAKEGYANVAAVIAAHHDLDENENESVTEKTVVFLADKLVREVTEVSIEERFAESAAKCASAEAKALHESRYIKALSALERVQKLIGK